MAGVVEHFGQSKSLVRSFLALLTGQLILLAPLQAGAQESAPGLLADLSLEELMQVEVTSVSRREQSLSTAPASIYVISAEDIRRSGATTLPQILRLAPNLQVGRVNAYEYAITARGFNNSIGNKLLVLIDGRTAYTPLFSGVFWEMQDTLLADIERIEVISGPGATLWGINAVNGVINVITRNAADTRGWLLEAGAGNNAARGGLRYGGAFEGGGNWRVWGMRRERDNTFRANGEAQQDRWSSGQAGFRADWRGPDQQFTLLGDALRGETPHRGFAGDTEIPAVEVSSTNLLARWARQLETGSDLRVQAYWSHDERKEFILFSPESEIVDLEFQHHLSRGAHELLWGGGYRHASDEVKRGAFTVYIPARRELEWQNLFVQDEIQLKDSVRVTPGLRLEWNDFTGLEHLPSLRVSWEVSDSHLLWGSLSRAVRAPSRFDRDVYFPESPPFIIAGGADFQSEVARVSEVGYRGQLANLLNYSVTLYHHDWEDLRSGSLPPPPFYLQNDIEGEAYGVEAWATWQVAGNWRLHGGFTTLEKNLRFEPGTGDTVGVNNDTLHNDPDYQWLLRSDLQLGPGLDLNLQLRHVAELTVQPVPAYTELDARLGWRVGEALELSVAGRNLLDRRHPEFGAWPNRSEIGRGVLFELRWTP